MEGNKRYSAYRKKEKLTREARMRQAARMADSKRMANAIGFVRSPPKESSKTPEEENTKPLERLSLNEAKDLSTGQDSKERDVKDDLDKKEEEKEKVVEDNNYEYCRAKDLSTGRDSNKRHMENYFDKKEAEENEKKPDLHFIDTGSDEDLNPSRRKREANKRMLAGAGKIDPYVSVNNTKFYPHVKYHNKGFHKSQQNFNNNEFEPLSPIANSSKNNSHQAASNPNTAHDKKTSIVDYKRPKDDKPVLHPSMFESSKPIKNLSPASNKYNFHNAALKPTKAHDKAASMCEFQKPILIHKKDDHSVNDKLSDNFNSTLRFDEIKQHTDDLLLQGCHNKTKSISKNYPNNSSPYEPKETDHTSYLSNCKANSSRDQPSEMDIFVHTWIRHDPPPSLAPNTSFQETDRAVELFSLNDASQQYFSHNSLEEKEDILNTQPQSVSFPPLSLINVQNKGIATHVPDTNYPPGFVTPAAHPGLHVNSTVPSVSPYNLPESNTMTKYPPGFVTPAAHPGLHVNSTVPSVSPYNLPESNRKTKCPPGFETPAAHPGLHVNSTVPSVSPYNLPESNTMTKYPPGFVTPAAYPGLHVNSTVPSVSPYNFPESNTMTNYPPGFVTPAAHPGLHVNSTVPSVSPYNLPESNTMMPRSFSSQDLLNPQIAHYYQQQLMLQQASQAERASLSLPIAHSQEEIIFQYYKAQQMLIYWRQQLAEKEAQMTGVPPLFFIPTQPIEMSLNNNVQPVQGMHQCQPQPVQPVCNTGQLSAPEQQDASVASGL